MQRRLLLLLSLLLICVVCSVNRDFAEAGRLSEAEIAVIVDEALERGEIANAFYLGDWRHSVENFYEYDEDTLFWQVESIAASLPIPDGAGVQYSALDSWADVENMFGAAFVAPLSEQYLTDIAEQYVFVDGVLYLNEAVAVRPLSLIVWQHEPLKVIEQTAERLTVELAGTYMLTGNEVVLPVNLIKQGNDWLLDESFSPIEYAEGDCFYSQTEVNEILADVMARAELANYAAAADSFHIVEESVKRESDKTTALIDTDNQDEAIYAQLAKKLKTINDVENCFREAFVSDVAQEYSRKLPESEAYVERPGGLAVRIDVSYMPIMMMDWDMNDYTVWLNSEREIILIMRAAFNDEQEYYAFRLQKDGERWLCDETYAPTSKYSWVLN